MTGSQNQQFPVLCFNILEGLLKSSGEQVSGERQFVVQYGIFGI